MSILFDYLLIFYFLFYVCLFVVPFSPISNIGGPTVGLAFLLAARFLLNKKTFSLSPLIVILKKIIDTDHKKLLFFIFAALFTVLSVLSIARHLGLSSGAQDLGIFDQAVWNTAQGDILFSSLKGNINLLGDHFEPILLLIAPLYKIWSSVYILLLLQALLLASAVFPLYLIARNSLKNRFIALAFIISYTLSKPMRGIGLSDFHPESFILPLLFWAYYFLVRRKNALLFLSLIFLLLSKEDTAFLISGLGIYTFFAQKRKGLGIILFFLGIGAWIALTEAVIPCFNPEHQYVYTNRLPLGATYADNFKAVLNHPFLLSRAIFNRQKISYCLKLFGPLGFLSFFSPPHYILIAIPLFKNLLAGPDFSGFYNISSHYTASVIPFIYISGIYGAARLIAKIRNQRAPLFTGLFVIFLSLMFYGKTDGYKLGRYFKTIKAEKTGLKLSYLKLIPKNASVSANFNLVPHLSHRKYIFEWHPLAKASFIAEYIVLDMDLLEYIPQKEQVLINGYLDQIGRTGYRKVFSDETGSFLILQNPDIDKSLAEKYQ